MPAATLPTPSQPRFEPGLTASPPGALEACSIERITQCLARHLTADWGCVCADDAKENNAALINGDRLLSAYPIDPAKPSAGFGENTLWNKPRRFVGAIKKGTKLADCFPPSPHIVAGPTCCFSRPE
jgi:hypothetical protein